MSSFNVSVFSLPLFLSAALLSFPGEEAQARAALFREIQCTSYCTVVRTLRAR